jgi:hypothetical protein
MAYSIESNTTIVPTTDMEFAELHGLNEYDNFRIVNEDSLQLKFYRILFASIWSLLIITGLFGKLSSIKILNLYCILNNLMLY